MNADVMPVSYTHLDVYKRHALFLAYHLAGILSEFVRSSVMWNRADYDINRRRFAQCVPVHTGFAARFVYIAGWRSDVYKRQVLHRTVVTLPEKCTMLHNGWTNRNSTL